MVTRTLRTIITFKHEFMLSSTDGKQAPGTYMVETDEEQIEGLSFLAYRRIATSLYLPAVGMKNGLEQIIPTNPQELARALERDAQAH